jgi:DNA-directed RNA polymerase subunit L
LALDIDYCQFDVNQGYAHPLRHCPQYQIQDGPAEKVDSLQDALEQLRQSMEVVKRFLPEGKER